MQKLMAASDETIDAELLSVYLEEAGEVLGTVAESLEQAREVPQNMEVLRTIRRGFHTLKGSGRMVGLTRLGEAAWAVEQVMNRWLEEERAATPDLVTLVAMARQFFEGAVASLKAGGASPDESRSSRSRRKKPGAAGRGDAEMAAPAPAPRARRCRRACRSRRPSRRRRLRRSRDRVPRSTSRRFAFSRT
jgi:chemosensory pili system protein ChpA (sensor histidine kinase/response regulator)